MNTVNILKYLLITVITCGSVVLINTIPAQAQSESWSVPDSAKTLKNPLDSSKTIIGAGKKMYVQLCQVCHGKNGEGNGVTSASLNPKPADLTSGKFQNQTDGIIYWKIREGNPPMPSFKSQLSEKQTWALVAYLRTLTK